MLTDQPGLFTNDPRRDTGARLINEINTPEIPQDIWQAAGGTNSSLGTGGMYTKLSAADLARRSGTTVVIASGMDPDVLLRVAAVEPVGTRLMPVVSTMESRKRYLLAGKKSTGVLQIDDGAVQAILQGGSLLPVGVKDVRGKFERGDTVRVTTLLGKEVALGLVNYSAKDLASFYGRQSAEIERLLGYTFGDEVIHRNNMLLL